MPGILFRLSFKRLFLLLIQVYIARLLNDYEDMWLKMCYKDEKSAAEKGWVKAENDGTHFFRIF